MLNMRDFWYGDEEENLDEAQRAELYVEVELPTEPYTE
jgi:hypothetical protein